jgi:putative ABC transport system permease protein
MPSLFTSLLSRRRTPPLALRNVLESPRKSALAIGGMGFALVMVFLQLGFLEAVRVTARVNFDALEFDIALVSPYFEQFYDAGSFPRARLRRALAVESIEHARPLWARMDIWRCPTPPPDARYGLPGQRQPRPGDAAPALDSIQRRALLVLGIDLADNPFRDPIRSEVDRDATRLRLPDRVLLNRLSNPDFGPDRIGTFDGWELGLRKVHVVGTFTLPRSFGADATVLASDDTFKSGLPPGAPADHVSFGLLTVAPGTLESSIRVLRDRLPADVEPLTRAELYNRESHYWVRQTATGLIFSFGVGVTLLVASIVVYQVLTNDVRNRLHEYATLKAMGYSDSRLVAVVIAQALLYGVLAYLPAVAVATVLYNLTQHLATIPMVLTPGNLGLVLMLTIISGLVSGVLAISKLRSANPADLF